MSVWCRLSADLGAFVGLSHESSSLGGSPIQSPGPSVCPFPMPAQYEEAKESKVNTVAQLRNSIKSVSITACCRLPIQDNRRLNEQHKH